MSKQSDIVKVSQDAGTTGFVNVAGDTVTGSLTLETGRTYFGKDEANATWFATSDAVSEPNNLGYGFASNGSAITLHRFYTNGLQRMLIDSDGSVTMPYQPIFMGQPTTDYSGSDAPVGVMDVTALYNNGNHFNAVNNRFTAPVTGWYRITWGGLMPPTGVVSLQVNGVRTYNGVHAVGTLSYVTMTQTVTRTLNASDYLTLEQWNTPRYYNAWFLWSVELIA